MFKINKLYYINYFFQFFNENSNLRKQLDEKTNDLSEKNKLIFTFQTKLTNLTNQYQSLQDKQKNLLEFSQSSNPSNIIKPQRNFKENLGFIDKHIIKPIRGGSIYLLKISFKIL